MRLLWDSQKRKISLLRDRSSLVVSLVLILGAAMPIACDNNKKKNTPKVVNDSKTGDQGGLGGGAGDTSTTDSSTQGGKDGGGKSGKDSERKDATGSSSNDLSYKLTAEEKKSLNRFSCKNKNQASKFVAFARLVKDGDRDTIDAIAKEYDRDKVEALIKLAKAVGSSESKAKATLKAICDEGDTSSN
jgi:hypothetical protein